VHRKRNCSFGWDPTKRLLELHRNSLIFLIIKKRKYGRPTTKTNCRWTKKSTRIRYSESSMSFIAFSPNNHPHSCVHWQGIMTRLLTESANSTCGGAVSICSDETEYKVSIYCLIRPLLIFWSWLYNNNYFHRIHWLEVYYYEKLLSFY